MLISQYILFIYITLGQGLRKSKRQLVDFFYSEIIYFLIYLFYSSEKKHFCLKQSISLVIFLCLIFWLFWKIWNLYIYCKLKIKVTIKTSLSNQRYIIIPYRVAKNLQACPRWWDIKFYFSSQTEKNTSLEILWGDAF